ncbi:PREDICTED: uncharacterized protein LOC107357587 [Acropora digitifera]|uniref:uncharacterized protein LOC107357587 n=1 Tax=Acropora digitifera TaxID=70779 RepID=UPI00077A4CC5|nr:PREDICTED: uncharacterized protein LOC107357587 [Acropora digitifera]
MKKYMAICLWYFLFVAITIPGMEAKPHKAIDANKRFMNLPRAFDASSAYDLAWQALHMAAAAACRGSTPTGGSGSHVNPVLARNPHASKTCKQLCSDSGQPYCDAEVSIRGFDGKATTNGQVVAQYYNYGCNTGYWGYGGNEPGAHESQIQSNDAFGAYSFCCCRQS